MSHSSTLLSSPSSVSPSQRLPCRSALECAPGISTTEQWHFTLHFIPFSPCYAPQQHFVYRATTAFWMDGKMSWNANGLVILLWQGSQYQSNNIYSVMPALSKSLRQTWDDHICGQCNVDTLSIQKHSSFILHCFVVFFISCISWIQRCMYTVYNNLAISNSSIMSSDLPLHIHMSTSHSIHAFEISTCPLMDAA